MNMADLTLDEETLQQIYTWIDDIPLSRPKRNISRDFSDGVLIAEIVHHFIPKMVDLHNYVSANSSTQKMDNWNQLSRKCFSKISFNINENLVKGAVSCNSGAIEVILRELRYHIESYLARKEAAAMLENNRIHDEIGSDAGSCEMADGYNSINGYDPNYNGYGYPTYTDPYGNHIPNHHQQQQQQQQQQVVHHEHPEAKSYQYQGQPHAIQDIRANPPGQRQNRDLSPKHNADAARNRKPVTQASKMKTKRASTIVTSDASDTGTLRMALEEKEQALLASQETVQILQAKVRRLEHLLHLKDLRINELKGQHPLTHQHPLPHQHQQQVLNGPPTRHVISNQSYPLQPPSQAYTNSQLPPHPPLPQIPRPLEDTRKFQR